MERNGGGSFLGRKLPTPTKIHNTLWNQGEKKHSEGNGDNDTPSQSSFDVFKEREGGGRIRVGRDFQAKIPDLIPVQDRNLEAYKDRALLVWKSVERITDDEIQEYLSMAKEKYKYAEEQALGLLYWHRYDIAKTALDLGNFTPHPEEWTKEDKVLFEQAFQYHGKCFEKIRQMMREKSMATLIRYYYGWKKRQNKSSALGRQAQKLSHESKIVLPGSGSGHPAVVLIPNNIQSESDDEKRTKRQASTRCGNCGVPCKEVYTKENLCNTCFIYLKNTGDSRPLTGPLRRGNKKSCGVLRQRGAPPKDLNMTHLNMLGLFQPQAEDEILQGLEKEVLDMKSRIQNVKQRVEFLRRQIPEGGLKNLRPNATRNH